MDEIHVNKTKKSICAHFAESPCSLKTVLQIEDVKIENANKSNESSY